MTTVLGHLALHYAPGDERPARRLLELLGYTLVDNGPAPGADGFCTVLLDGPGANYADNIMFLSRLTDVQVELEDAIRGGLRAGQPDQAPSLQKYLESSVTKPESNSHIGIRYRSFEALERVLIDLEQAGAPGGELAGRVELVKYRPSPGVDSVDARIAASRAFDGSERSSFAPHWVQCFVNTDLCGFGILAFGNTFELDYVFEPFFAAPPSFGNTRPGRSG